MSATSRPPVVSSDTGRRLQVPVGSPFTLALLRIVVPLVIVASPELHVAPLLAGSPRYLGFVPEGLGIIARIPLDQQSARVLQIVAFSSAATACLGLFSRASMLVLTLSAGILFSLSQRQGTVLHDMFLFWMTALLAVSPCGDAWSLDSLGKERPANAARYGVPLTLARILLGLVYFFPGLHKLRVSGLAWLSSENVIGHMHAKWLQYGTVPALRIDRAPALCAAGAFFVVAFELSFLVLALVSQRTRWVALGAGLAFHLSTQLFFFIPFVSLWACYVILVDGDLLERVDRRIRRGSEGAQPPPSSRDPIMLPLVVGLPLVLAALVQGARAKTEAWPFACFPTFAHVQPGFMPDLAVDLVKTDGTTTRLTGREHRVRSQAEWGRVFRISGAYGDPRSESALRDHAMAVARGAGIAPADVTSAKLFLVDVPTAPEAWRETPRGGVLLIELPGPLGIR